MRKLLIYSCADDIEILLDVLDILLAVVYFVRILKSKIERIRVQIHILAFRC